MELDRAHRSTTPGKLFVCFTSRLSHSSSMRFSSKSILSPCRSDKPSVSLSHSLSRRLRTSGSVKGCGGQSPMFLSAFGKKRGCAFENAEPSSPKVTCIGQVRVKTKKQGKKMRILRACRSREGHGDGTGEASFRKMGHNRERLTHQNSQSLYQGCLRHRNQRWVHLPLTICEALRAFGTEFSCFVPCKSSCFSNGVRETGGKATGSNGLGARGDDSSSCGGTVFRWFVALHEGGGKTRNLELVVGGEEEETAVVERESSRRRSIFDDKEFEDEFCGVENAEDDPGVGICIPPKNALLLMRCRSDPMRMAALANKFWDSPLAEDDAEEEEEEEEEEVEATEECVNEDEEKREAMQVRDELEKGCEKIDEICDDWVLYKAIVEGQEVGEDLGNSAEDEEQEQLRNEAMKDQSSECRESQQVKDSEKQDAERSNQLIEAGIESNWCSVEPTEKLEEESNESTLMKDHLKNQDDELEETPKLSNQFSSEENHEEVAQQEEGAATEQVLETEIILLGNEGGQEQSIQERENQENSSEDDEMPVTQRKSAESQTTQEQTEAEKPMEDRETEADEVEEQETVKKKPPMNKKKQQQQERESSVLPDCLLLMISEPKLSMEVSKETWVCSTDFIRLLPERHHHHHHKLVNQKNGCDEQQKTVVAYSNPPPVNTIAPPPQAVFQPPRSSCSFPIVSTNGGVSMASLIEQKLVGAVAYEPFVLTRCKSEPMKSSANFAPPELACFWKSRKLEPHRPASFGVGAAGVGF